MIKDREPVADQASRISSDGSGIVGEIYIYIYVAGTFRDHVNNILVYTCNEHLYELE